MRIISGTHKGIRLKAPKRLPVRPTTDRAKEGLFNLLANRYYFKEKNILDLFSGTGNISYEFASRGCTETISVDRNINCINYIKHTAQELDLNIKTINSECCRYLKDCKKRFNFVFADPPYNYNQYIEMKKLIMEKKIIKKDGCLIIEHDKHTSFNDECTELRRYGAVHFSIFSF